MLLDLGLFQREPSFCEAKMRIRGANRHRDPGVTLAGELGISRTCTLLSLRLQRRRAALYEPLSKSRGVASEVLGSHTHDPDESDRIGHSPWWAAPGRALSQIGRDTC